MWRRKLLPSFKGKGGLLGWKQEQQPLLPLGEMHAGEAGRHRGTAALSHSLGSPGEDLPPRAPTLAGISKHSGQTAPPRRSVAGTAPKASDPGILHRSPPALSPAKGLAWRSTDARNRGGDVRAPPTARRHVLTSWGPRPAGWWARPASCRSRAVSETSPGPGLLWRRNRSWSVSQRPDLKTRKQGAHYTILTRAQAPRTLANQQLGKINSSVINLLD